MTDEPKTKWGPKSLTAEEIERVVSYWSEPDAGLAGGLDDIRLSQVAATLFAQAREIERLKTLIDDAGKPFLALDPGLAWEGAIDSAMSAACSEVTTLRARVAELEGLLGKHQWSVEKHDGSRWCPECRGNMYTDGSNDGHYAHCKLRSALRGEGE